MTGKNREVVISKGNAVFWLDSQGYWRNDGGKLRKKKIIDYFHRSIAMDEGGYHVWQDKGGVTEKVYFVYEDTALFVFDVIIDETMTLILNTGVKIRLDPARLFIENDSLYLEDNGERIKFTVRAMMKLSKLFSENENGGLIIRAGGNEYVIVDRGSSQEMNGSINNRNG